MKKILLVLVFIFVVQFSFAQKNYARLAFCYGKGSNKSLYLFDPLQNDNLNQTQYATPSLGESVLLNGGVGHMFNKIFGLEANVSYMHGLDLDLYKYSQNGNIYSAKTNNRQILFLPTTVFRIDIKKIHPYIKVGLVIPIYNQSSFYYNVSDPSSAANFNTYEYAIKNQLNIGLNGCVGLSYNVSKKIELFFEAEEDNVRSFHNSADLVSKSTTGNIKLSKSPPQHVDFVAASSINTISLNSQLNFPISFAREAYNIGIKFNF
jgi:hypothetical protein